MMNDFTPVTGDLETSAEFVELAKALAKAQADMGSAIKNKDNTHFKSRYADLASVVDAAVPALNKHGIAVLQPVAFDGEYVRVSTMLLHESGQWVRACLQVPIARRDAHSIGSAVTYGRRFGLQSMTGLAPDDDDGNGASGVGDGKPPKKRDTQPNDGRLSSAEAKRQGLHEAFKADLATVTSLDALSLWEQDRYPDHIARVPYSWIDAMANAVELHREALNAGDFRQSPDGSLSGIASDVPVE